MTVNKDRANSWNISKPHTSDSCGGDEHIDIGRFDEDGKPDKSFGKHHVETKDVPDFIDICKDILGKKS